MDPYPKLRPLDFQPVQYQGKYMWYLRDPLHLSDDQIFVPQEMTPIFTFLDGLHTPGEIHAGFCQISGLQIPYEVITDAIIRLDTACLLENERSQNAISEQLLAYRSQPNRKPAIAGHGYPSDQAELAIFLKEFENGANSFKDSSWAGRGVISPHIDYQRGGSVYAKVWKQASKAIQDADLVIIFGTDHNGAPGSITLTQQAYTTPYGELPLDKNLVEILANAIGPDFAFADELHHRDEHSVELSAVWLHHILHQNGIESKPMIPILIGSFHHYLMDGNHPMNDERINLFIETLKKETSGKNVLAVGSVDFAHVGPNFGDNFLVDASEKSRIKDFDQQLIESALAGDAEGWFSKISGIQNRNRICGFSPTYMLLRFLGPTNGIQVAYDQCPADVDDTSIVSICGLLLE